jgi:hypothetical protein
MSMPPEDRRATERPVRLGERELGRLLEVGRSLVSELDIEAVLREVLETARELTGARYAALGILDEPKRELERFLFVGIGEHMRRTIGPLPRGRGVLGELIRRPEPLRLGDVTQHPRSYGFPPGHPPMSARRLAVAAAIAGVSARSSRHQVRLLREQVQNAHRPVLVPVHRNIKVPFRRGEVHAHLPHHVENPPDRDDPPPYSAVFLLVENIGRRACSQHARQLHRPAREGQHRLPNGRDRRRTARRRSVRLNHIEPRLHRR